MSLQVVGPGEASVADLAAEGSFPGVLSHVRLEVVLQVEAATADVAHERSLLRVGLHVSLELGTGLEGQVATRTLELLFGVRPLVVLQALSVWETDFTLSAAVVGEGV